MASAFVPWGISRGPLRRLCVRATVLYQLQSYGDPYSTQTTAMATSSFHLTVVTGCPSRVVQRPCIPAVRIISFLGQFHSVLMNSINWLLSLSCGSSVAQLVEHCNSHQLFHSVFLTATVAHNRVVGKGKWVPIPVPITNRESLILGISRTARFDINLK